MPVPALSQRLVQAIEDSLLPRACGGEAVATQAVAEAAGLCWLDWATAVLCGLDDPLVRAVMRVTGDPRELVESLRDRSKRLHASGCSQLAFLLGTAAHVQEIDDTLPDCMVHAGAPVIAAAFSTGLVQDISGPQFLRAIAMGYEVISRIGRAMNAPPRMATHARGFHPTGVVGVLGAAVAAATAMGLDGEAAGHALALATSMSSGLLEFLGGGGDTKALHAGKAAADGVMAANLAVAGLRGPATALEGRDGLLRAFAGKADLAVATEGLALETAAVLRTQRKYYACCHHCHPSVEALAVLHRRRPFSTRDVAEIDVRLPSMGAYQVAVPVEAKRRPTSSLEARLSLPYCLAAWLVLEHLGPSAFEPTHIGDPEISALAARISGRSDSEMDAAFTRNWMPAVVTVRLRNGEELVQSVGLGSAPEDPTTERSRVKAKFTSFLTSLRGADELEDLWLTLDRVAIEGPDHGIGVLTRRWNE